MQPGRVARRDSEYRRCGTANVFCGVEPKAGWHFTKVTAHRSSLEFADYLLDVAEHYPSADTIHLVMDNLSSHTRQAVVDRFGDKAGGGLWNRFTVHYTPKHGSWLKQHVFPAMPWQTPDRRPGFSVEGNSRLENPDEPRPGDNPMEVHSQTSSAQVWLRNHAVTVLILHYKADRVFAITLTQKNVAFPEQSVVQVLMRRQKVLK